MDSRDVIKYFDDMESEQVRIEYESDCREDVYNFDTREAAEQGFRETCEQVREEHDSDDVQERIEPAFEEGNQ